MGKSKNMTRSDLGKAEAVSALMDGEVDELSLHRALRDIEEDQALRDMWHRYHMVSASMKNELPERMTDLSSRISAAIAEEKSPVRLVQRWLQPVGRFAIAASVTVVAVFGVQQYANQQQDVPLASMDASSPEAELLPLPSMLTIPQIPARTVSATQGNFVKDRPVEIKQTITDRETYDRVQRYLNDMMLQHTENAAINTSQGMMPFARMPNIPQEGR